jgi:hypothetical protein
MISITKARKLLGIPGRTLSEETIQHLLDQCYALAEVMYVHFSEVETSKKKGAFYAKSARS